MDNTKYVGGSGGIGFSGLLTIIFIVLKLIGVIDWSWWWVISPLWIGVGLVFFLFLIAFVLAWFATK